MTKLDIEKFWRSRQDSFAAEFNSLAGKTIKAVHPNYQADEGLVLEFTDGTRLDIGYSGEEGSIEWNVNLSLFD